MQTARPGGVRVVSAGTGPPVLFLHGIGSSAASFARQLDGLADRCHMVAWDAPGYAGSADPRRPPGMDGYADTVASLLDDLAIGTAHLVGVSWGGVIATRVALRHPDRVRTLVLSDSTTGSGSDPERAAAMRARGEELARDGADQVARRRAPRLLSPAAPSSLVGEVTTTMAEAIRLPGYRWAAEAMAETDHSDALPTMTVPTLVLVGEHDAVAPPAESERLAAGIPDARLDVVPAAGHLSNQEQPRTFNDLVSAWISS